VNNIIHTHTHTHTHTTAEGQRCVNNICTNKSIVQTLKHSTHSNPNLKHGATINCLNLLDSVRLIDLNVFVVCMFQHLKKQSISKKNSVMDN